MSFEHLYYDEKDEGAVGVVNVDGSKYLVDGVLKQWEGECLSVLSPVRRRGAKDEESSKIHIGKYAMCSEDVAMQCVDAATAAYDSGRGEWPRMKVWDRIQAVKKFAEAMKAKRDEMVDILMWEICKTRTDSEKEVDRTIQYINETINQLTKMENDSNGVVIEGGIVAQVKRSPLGVALIAGPFNYPINEMMTLFIPAVIMGNTAIIKTPKTGGLVHMPLLEAYRDCFPKGVVSVVHGSGRTVFTPIMKCGKINILGFIGTHHAANKLHSSHPFPFTVRLALGLDAKNPAIVTESADLDVAVTETCLGMTSYNGQRCTAIKITFVHESIAEEYVSRVAKKIDSLKIGLPWTKGTNITPCAEPGKPKYIEEIIADAESKGAKCVNENGKKSDRTFVFPSVLYPCTMDMRISQEEQFGPVIPIVKYKTIEEIEDYFVKTKFGQQAAVFTKDADQIPGMIDFLAHHVTRININAQCQRGPDCFPFSGRKVSATGTLSLWDALRTMSIRVAVATKHNDTNVKIFNQVLTKNKSNVLNSEVIISKLL